MVLCDNLEGKVYIESAVSSLLRQWRGNSGIVEGFPEHDSRFQRFLGMVCRREAAALSIYTLSD